MNALRKLMLSATLVMLAALFTMPALAQSGLQKTVHFSINAPFELRNSDTVLPAGDYTLHQISANNFNLFALYEGKAMTSSPIAVLQTTTKDNVVVKTPSKTCMLLDDERENAEALPVIEGWSIPGIDSWEIISVKVDKDFANDNADLAVKNSRNQKIYANVNNVRVITTVE